MLRDVCVLLQENDMDVLLQDYCIKDANNDIIIRNEKDMLVVEGNVSKDFIKVQKLLSEQYQVIYFVCHNNRKLLSCNIVLRDSYWKLNKM